jgi:Glycosyl transferase family 2
MIRHKQIGTIAYMGGIMAVPEPFCWAWGNLCAYSQEALCQEGEHIHFDRTKLSLHDFARNDLLSRMRGDWILMLDTDLSFEPDLAARLVRLFELNRLDVLCGIYSYKSAPHFPVVYQHNKTSDRHEIMAGWDPALNLVQIDSAGAGLLLIRRNVLERITGELHENPFDRYANKGEDHSFFMRLRKLGINAWCAPHVEADHLEFWGVRTSVDYVPPETFDHQYERLAL